MTIFTVGLNPAIDRILECPDFHIGGHQPAHQVARLAAGKAANVSRALAQLGAGSIATGFVGINDLEFFHQQLLSCGPGRILCRFVEVSGRTRENISILDPRRHLETHLRDRGFQVSPAETELLSKRLLHEVHPGDILVFSGSLCDGVTYSFMENLVDRCVAAGAHVAVDSGGDVLKHLSRHNLWLIKPNVNEFIEMFEEASALPSDGCAIPPLLKAARSLLPNVQQVLISRGPQGALLVTRQGSWTGRLPDAPPAVRTVGCGDYLLAGYLAEITAGRDPAAALAAALAVAAGRAVARDMAEFDPEDIRRFAAAVEVETLE